MTPRHPIAAAAALTLILSTACGAHADNFYKDKTITLIIGANPGGGYDLYGRALSRHYARHIPGEPNIVVQNMPGAGSVNAANHMANRASKDGLTIGMIFPGAIIGPLLDDKIRSRAKYKPREFEYLGTANVSTRVCATYHTSKTRTFEDALTRTTVIGADAPGGSLFDYANFLRNEVGAKFKVSRGYKGSTDITLAMERGEVEGICGFDWSSLRTQKRHWVTEKKANFILQVAPDEHEGLAKMGVPTLWKYVKDKGTREVLELIVSQQVFGRPFLVPAGTAKPQLAALRKAFDATMKDKAFLADAGKMGLEIAPAPGARVQAVVNKLYAAPQSVVARAKKALAP
jgi:tripartite-type tricarboxylate transporter receptor subunit TctC